MYILIVKVAILVKRDLKAPSSIATTLRYRKGHYPIPWIAPLYSWSLPYNASVKQGGIKYHFLSLWYDLTWEWTPVFQTIDEHYLLGQNIYKIQKQQIWITRFIQQIRWILPRELAIQCTIYSDGSFMS